MSIHNTNWTVIEEGPGRRTLRLAGAAIDLTTWASREVDVRGFTRASLHAVDANQGVAWNAGVLALQTTLGALSEWAPKFGTAGQTKRIVSGSATEIGATTAATLTALGLLWGVDITDDALLRAVVTAAGDSGARADLILTLTNPLRLE